MRLTRRGRVVLAGAIAGYLLGEFAGYPLLRMLAGLALFALGAAVLSTLVRPKAEVSRELHPDRIERGRPALATLTVRNPTTRRQVGFAAGDRVGSTTHHVQVRPLAPGTEATYHYELPTSVRGRVQVGPLALHRLDPFDLASSHLATGGTDWVWVHPRRHAVRPASAGHPRHHHDGPISDRPLRGSIDLRSVREYVVGDEVRTVHWKATARTGRLMVREYVDPAQPRFTVVLDTRPGVLTPALFEEAVEVAASLLYASSAAGQTCRLITPAGADTTPDSGPRVARMLLDALCLVAQDAPNDAPLLPRTVPTARPAGAIAVITGPVADLGRAMAWRPDTVIRLGPASARGAADGVRLITAPDAAGVAAGWNSLRVGSA